MRTAWPLRMLGVIVLFALPACAQADFGVNLYGFSYHLERDKARALGINNQVNPGLGLRYRIHQSPEFDWVFDAGFYRDSGRHTAKIAGAGLLWHATDHLRLGAALTIFNSPTYNSGKTFVAPLPIIAYEFKSVTLNLAYSPRIRGLNDVNMFGVWATFWLP